MYVHVHIRIRYQINEKLFFSFSYSSMYEVRVIFKNKSLAGSCDMILCGDLEISIISTAWIPGGVDGGGAVSCPSIYICT